jgi:hypothetical protein
VNIAIFIWLQDIAEKLWFKQSLEVPELTQVFNVRPRSFGHCAGPAWFFGFRHSDFFRTLDFGIRISIPPCALRLSPC